MLQVSANREIKGTVEQLESEIMNFKFCGPGVYLTDASTIVVQVLDPVPNHWSQRWPKGTLFHAAIFNVSFSETLLSIIGGSPVRKE